jgi:hypothetical protein
MFQQESLPWNTSCMLLTVLGNRERRANDGVGCHEV